MKTIKFLTFIGVICLGLFAFKSLDQEPWKVPAKYEKMTNPEEASKENIAIGKSMYAKHCKSCHGKEGLGDGPKADEVEGDLGDFSSKKFQAQSDGALFYKSYIGRDDMPSFEKKMSEEDMWLTVHYMRTMGEK
ncbi:cytochrome c [uncultured Lutibacter sp.]|uniref:c-type cytochrome n=1 Tax=uncultured Lutibacter sp. TaxID=437739 RepID=UPI00261181D8|nr:cytochrome c [uncultured Lutibacter sp.]